MNTLSEIEEAIKGKKIAIIGNSKKVIGKKYPIDQYDVVIRINRAWNLPESMKNDVGRRLDILCISGGERKNLENLVSSEFRTIWMARKRRDEINPDIANKLSFYPIEWWYELYENIGEFPSTGCMAFDLFSRLIGDDGHITLYGFDFFQSDNWYNKKKIKNLFLELLGKPVKLHPHSESKEEEYICNKLSPDNFTIERL